MHYGASPDDWAHFDLILGLGADLLPVVSKPGAAISEGSSLKALGKTPSAYNRAGRVVGIPQWTLHQASDHEISRWAKQPDYGICVQTRVVRFIDIDVPDAAASAAIAAAFEDALAVALPRRVRGNSGKLGLAFLLEGEWPKRILRVDGGVVEFLGNGQQFVAVGTHPSGARYEWPGGLPDDVPQLTAAQFEQAWAALEIEFGAAPAISTALVQRQRGAAIDVADPVADYLEAQGLVLGEDARGALLVACPWAGEHTGGEDGDSSTVWFRAGTNGYPKGHFKCLHAHCEGRSDGEFWNAIGYSCDVSGEFDVVAGPDMGIPMSDDVLPSFARDKSGAIPANINNLVAGVASRKCAGAVIGYDHFRDEIMQGPGGDDGWQRFTDVDYTRLQMRLETWGFKPIAREMLRNAVEEVARRNSFDSAILWLERKVPAWDGVPRVQTFLRDYWGAEDGPYTRAVSRYLWTALAGRVLVPGVKADMVPIFVGPQGCGKSTGVMALAPTDDVCAEISLHEKEDDLSRRIKGRLVVELGELRGLHTRELEAIKAWITRRTESWVPKYKEFATHYARRCVFFGTTNQDQFLADSTGNRRWLPVRVSQVKGFSEIREQLWAEAREAFRAAGVSFADAERLAGDAHEEHTMPDPTVEPIGRWLDTEEGLGGGKPGERPYLTTSEVAEGALGLKPGRNSARRDEIAIGEVLRAHFGYVRRRVMVQGARKWVFARP